MYTMMSLYLICSIFYIYIGVYTYTQNKTSPLHRVFLSICMVLFFWGFFLALMSSTSDPALATLFRVLVAYCWSVIFALILLFTIMLTENSHYLKTPLHYAIIFIPSLVCIILYVFDPVTISHIIKTPIGWAFLNPTDKGILWDVFLNIYYISYMVFTFLLLVMWFFTTKLKRKKMQAITILSTLILTFLIGTFTDIILPLFQIKLLPPLTIFVILFVIVGIAVAMNRYELMSITKEKVTSKVFKVMKEGLIILDDNYLIQYINEGALNMLNFHDFELIHKHITLLFGDDSLFKNLDTLVSKEVDLNTKSRGSLPTLLSSSTIYDRYNDRIGNVIMFQNLSKYMHIQDELRLAYEELEDKVHERTIELSIVNEQLGAEIETRKETEAQVKQLALHDTLTNLPNRRHFNKILGAAIHQSHNNETKFALLFLDLDNFKAINDTHGHDIGDELLIAVTNRLKTIVRDTDFIARLAGDEFVILINSVKTKKDVTTLCNHILKDFNLPFSLTIGDYHVSVSIGIALYPTNGETLHLLLKNSDSAMYVAKDSGKNTFVFFDEL